MTLGILWVSLLVPVDSMVRRDSVVLTVVATDLFPVAITRAQALLIIVGDPSVLGLDPLWRGFLNYIYLGGGWRGLEPDWDPNEPIVPEGSYDVDRRKTAQTEMESLIERTKTLIIENSEQLGTQGEEDGDGQEGQVDRPWHEAE